MNLVPRTKGWAPSTKPRRCNRSHNSGYRLGEVRNVASLITSTLQYPSGQGKVIIPVPRICRWDSEQLNSLPKVTQPTNDNIMSPRPRTTFLDLPLGAESEGQAFGGVLWPAGGSWRAPSCHSLRTIRGCPGVFQRSRPATYLAME